MLNATRLPNLLDRSLATAACRVSSARDAARLEGIAEPGGVFISRQVYDQVDGKVALSFRKLGPQNLKNMDVVLRESRALERHRIALTRSTFSWMNHTRA